MSISPSWPRLAFHRRTNSWRGILAGAAHGLIIVAETPGALERLPRPPHARLAPSGDMCALLAHVKEALQAPVARDSARRLSQEVLSFDGFTLDLPGHVLLDPAGREVALTRAEFALLAVFADRPGRVLSRDQLRLSVTGEEADAYDRSVDVLVSRLRRKIERDPKMARLILTVPGVGYKLAARVRAAAAPVAAFVDAEPAFAPSGGAADCPLPAERRQLTVMACEFAGLAALSARLDPEDLREIMSTYRQRCADAVARHNGEVAHCLGDGFVAYFGHRCADEAHAEQAVRAGLTLVGARADRTSANEPSLSFRIGIASGLAIVGGAAGERAAVGEPPNLAHRLQMAAGRDSLVIAESTRALVRGLFEYRDLGSIALAGYPEPVRAWRVVRPSAVASRFEALRGASLIPLVGRQEETALLLRRWQRAKTGRGEVILLTGEPGIGKSRLIAELLAALEPERPRRVRYFCAPHYLDSALRPAVLQLERAAGIKDDDPALVRRQKLQAMLSRGTSQEDQRLLSELLSLESDGSEAFAHLTPQQKKQKTLEAIFHQLEQLSRERPVLAIAEDLHWMDPSTRELLDLTVERIGSLPILLVATARPEFRARWTGRANITTLALNALDRRDGAAMIESVVGGRALPPDVLAQLIERTDGVPLYVEEVTKSVLESGLLRERGDRYELTAPLPLAIPTTLQASLLARLDRLGPVKEIAQAAAAIGREFSYALIAAVSGQSQARLIDALNLLVDAGLILRRGAPPEAKFTFKHALLQDAAYGSMVKSQRQQLHQRIAHVLAEQFPRVAEVEPETLAQHYAQAGQREKAIEHRERAGQRAARRLAWREAGVQFGEAVRLTLELPQSPERDARELALVLPLGQALYGSAGGAPEAETAYARARTLARGLGDRHAFCRAVTGLANLYGLTARVADGLALGRDAIAFGDKDGHPMTLLVAHRVLGSAHWHRGELLTSERHFREALAIAGRHGSLETAGFTSDPVVTLPINAAIPLWALGHADEALALEAASLSTAARADANTQGFTLSWAIFVALLRRDGTAAMRHATTLLRLVEEKGAKYFANFARWGDGAVLAMSGLPDEGLEKMRAGADRFRATGARLYEPYLWMRMAEAHLLLDQVDESFECLERARQSVGTPDQRFYAPELLRLFGASFRQRGEACRAERSYARAIEVARAQSGRSWELRATMDLARLWRDAGKTAQARDLLAPVAAWFPQSLDMPDMKAAKVVLDTLG